MQSANQLFRSTRPIFRNPNLFIQNLSQSRSFTFRAGARNAFRQSKGGYGKTTKRWSTTAAPAAEAQQSLLKRLWDSPVGIKTVHFWAPMMKWAIVIAGIGDMYRPAEKLSLTQNVALTATGIIWTRWCLIIKPKNIFLATVNFFLGAVGIVQVSRILMYRSSQKNESPKELLVEAKDDAIDTVKGALQK